MDRESTKNTYRIEYTTTWSDYKIHEEEPIQSSDGGLTVYANDIPEAVSIVKKVLSNSVGDAVEIYSVELIARSMSSIRKSPNYTNYTYRGKERF